MNKFLVSLLFMFLLCFIVVSAVPPQTSQPTLGLELRTPQQENFPLGLDINLHIHAYNVSNGVPILPSDGVGCEVHLYKNSGAHIIELPMEADGNNMEWKLDIEGENFTAPESLSYLIYCNDSEHGGFTSGALQITKSGTIREAGDILTAFIYILFVITLIGTVFYLILSLLNTVLCNQTIFGVLASWTFYMGLVTTNYLSKVYLLDYFIESITENFMGWAGWPLVLIPVISLILTMTKKGFDKKENLTPQELSGRQFVR